MIPSISTQFDLDIAHQNSFLVSVVLMELSTSFSSSSCLRILALPANGTSFLHLLPYLSHTVRVIVDRNSEGKLFFYYNSHRSYSYLEESL